MDGPSKARRYPRLVFGEPLTEQMVVPEDVELLDLSLTGARIEHAGILSPGSTCHLRLPLGGQSVTVICTVAWSRAITVSSTPPAGMTFHSGLQFTSLEPRTRALLTAFLDAEGTPPSDAQAAG